MANRSIRAGLFRPGASLSDALAWAARPHHQGQSQSYRCFSVSATRQARHAISFGRTSSKELYEILAKIHRLIILPSYLPENQQRKIFDPKHDMRADPVTMELDGKVIRFQHINPFTELPDSRNVVHQALKLMKTRGDWSNLPRLLEGIYGAGRKLRVQDYSGIVEKAGYSGEIFQVIEAARGVKRTGFSLKYPEVATELFLQLQLKAINSGYDQEQTKTALAWTERVMALLEEDHHKLKQYPPGEDIVPMHREPHVIAAALHLAAAVAYKHPDRQDVDGNVAKYAHILTALWPADKKLCELRPSEAYGVKSDKPLVNANQRLAILSPIVRGLAWSAQVLAANNNQDLADKVKDLLVVVMEEMQECRTIAVEGGAKRGPAVYDSLFGASQSQEQ